VVSSERLNILHSLKDCAGLIFSGLKLDPTIFTDELAKKKENEQLLALLKKDVSGEKYTHLAPILFMDPSALVPDNFLKTPVMVKVSNIFSCCPGSTLVLTPSLRSSELKYSGRLHCLGRPKDIQRPGVSIGLLSQKV
jgi:hypothetical protein